MIGRSHWAALALALPAAAALASIALNEASLAGASEWRIPIAGYDPRDPLRGRYVQFQYAWRAVGDTALCNRPNACTLCLEDGGATARIVAHGATCAARVLPGPSNLNVWRNPDGGVTASTRLWVSEAQGPALEQQLRTRPMVAVARLTRGGRLLPVRLEPARRQVKHP